MPAEAITSVALDYLEPILQLLIQLGAVIIMGLLGMLINYVSAKFKISKSATAEKLKTDLINSAQRDIDKVVGSLNQKMVGALKKQNPNGKLTDEQKSEVFNTALCLVKDLLSTDTVKAITSKYGNSDKWLETTIEYSVGINKPETENAVVSEHAKHVHDSYYDFPKEDGE